MFPLKNLAHKGLMMLSTSTIVFDCVGSHHRKMVPSKCVKSRWSKINIVGVGPKPDSNRPSDQRWLDTDPTLDRYLFDINPKVFVYEKLILIPEHMYIIGHQFCNPIFSFVLTVLNKA